MTVIGLVSVDLVFLIRVALIGSNECLVTREQYYLRRIKRCGVLEGRKSVGIRL